MRRRITVAALSLVVFAACEDAQDHEAKQASNGRQATAELEVEQATRPRDELRTLTVVTLDDRARLCPKPDCEEGQELARLPTGLVLNVQAEKSIHLPRWEVIWFQVSHEGRRGWVSEFETDLAPQTPRYR